MVLSHILDTMPQLSAPVSCWQSEYDSPEHTRCKYYKGLWV